MDGKFIVRQDKKTEHIRIYDVETKKYLDMNNIEDVKQLTVLLNDYYCIVKEKWKI